MKSFPTKVGFPVLVFITTFRFSPIVTFVLLKCKSKKLLLLYLYFYDVGEFTVIINLQLSNLRSKKIQSCQRKKIVSARPHPLEDELTVKCCLLKI